MCACEYSARHGSALARLGSAWNEERSLCVHVRARVCAGVGRTDSLSLQLYDLSEAHSKCLLIDYAIQCISNSGFNKEIASLATASTSLSVFHR